MKHVLIITTSLLFFITSSWLAYYATPNHDSHFDLDSPTYQRIADNICKRNKYLDPLNHDIPVQTIGYPLFLAFIQALFGYNLPCIIVIQIIITLLTIMLLYSLNKRLLGIPGSRVTLLLSCTNIGFIVFSQWILTETILTFFITLWLERFFTYLQDRKLYQLITACISIALSIIIKPILLFFVPVWLVYVLLFYDLTFTKNIKHTCLSFLITYAIITGYMTYNHITYDSFTIAPLAYENIYYYFLAKVLAQHGDVPVSQALIAIEKTCNGLPRSDSNRWNTARIILRDYAYAHPCSVIALWLSNVIKTWLGLFSTQLKILLNPALKGGDTSFSCTKGSLIHRLYRYCIQGAISKTVAAIALLEAFLLIIRYIFAAIGLLNLIRTKQYFIASFFVLYLGYCSIITGHDGCARYRMPLEPVLIILATSGILVSYRWFQKYAIPYTNSFAVTS